ncbi:MAG: Nif3-like dinuclear metal center hexameric protein [Halobacteriaceae archaeon]
MDVATLTERYDAELDTADYADIDASANGLQVGPGDSTVDHVAVAVDAARTTIEAAVDAGADVLVVHHGLVWDGIDRVTDRTYDRLAPLFEHDIALYVAHLPLDGHQTLGNAAAIADRLELVDRDPFGLVGDQPIGLRGRIPDGISPDALAGHLEADLPTGPASVRALAFGAERIQSVAIVTGSGADFFDAAVDADVDAFLTGEGKAHLYHDARDAGMNVVLAGHYATETGGVRNLQSLAEDWGLTTTYIDQPTGL